jgi:hypothetical protein
MTDNTKRDELAEKFGEYTFPYDEVLTAESPFKLSREQARMFAADCYEEGYDAASAEVAALKAERDRLKMALEKQKDRLREIDAAMGADRPEIAQEVWVHAVKEVNRALAPAAEGKEGG